MISIILKDNEIGYGEVGKYVERYWDVHGSRDVIVGIETSYDGIEWRYNNEIATVYIPSVRGEVEWLNDWWEGERYIRLHGIQSVETINVHGGLYEGEEN